MITSKQVTIGPGGVVYNPRDESINVQAIRIKNNSLYSAIDVFPDGNPASILERQFGAGRTFIRIQPTGFLEVPVIGDIAISPCGFLAGDNLSYSNQLPSSLSATIESFDYYLAPFEYTPPRISLGAWSKISPTVASGEILMTDLIPGFTVPQTDACLHLRITNEVHVPPLGTDGFRYLELISDGQSQYTKIIALSYNSNGYAQDIYFRAIGLTALRIITGETGQRAMSGFLTIEPAAFKKDRVRIFTFNGNPIDFYVSNYHVNELLFSYNMAVAAGSITAYYYDYFGNPVGSDTYAIPANSAGLLGIIPGGDLTRISLAAAAGAYGELLGLYEYKV